MEYLVIRAESPYELATAVNKALQSGYKLQGGASCSQGAPNRPTIFIQALVKEGAKGGKRRTRRN